MLAVVVDDFDMGVTHVIRGADHLNNAARQLQIIEAMGWPVPIYGHVPLIHGPDGAKLSKRHGALAVEAYRDMGYLPETMRNYLLRLGWSHGDDEIISTEQAIEWFNLESIGKSPARMDFKKLDNLNGHYIRETDDEALAAEAGAAFAAARRRRAILDAQARARLDRGDAGLKERAKTLVELDPGGGISVHGRSARRWTPRPRKLSDAGGARACWPSIARAGSDRLERPRRWKTQRAHFADDEGPQARPGRPAACAPR